MQDIGVSYCTTEDTTENGMQSKVQKIQLNLDMIHAHW